MNPPTNGDESGADIPGTAADRARADDGTEENTAVQAALRYLDNPATALELDTDTAPEVRAAVEILAAARDDQVALDHFSSEEPAVVAPPLADDPLAVALGLVPQEHVTLSGPALRNARQRARLKVSDLAKRLAEQGHNVRAGELQSWESAESVPVVPDLLAAVAGILNIAGSQLSLAPDVPPSLVASRRFHGLVRRFAAVRKLSLLAAQSALLAAAATPARRGNSFDEQHTLEVLDAFVEEHERRAGDQS